LGVLLGEEVELRRQLEQMEWLENFLRLEKSILSPTEFLHAWNRHSKVRSELYQLEHIYSPVDVKADLQVSKRIKSHHFH
jgi:hypothetical protein